MGLVKEVARDKTITVTLVAVNCGVCGAAFGLSEQFKKQRLEDGKAFYCPNGHCISYHDTELARTKRELIRAQNSIEYERSRREQEKRSHSATKGKLTKFKNRVHAGVCPCCNRTFQNLQAHMKTQHPDFKKEK